jgi:hypothetical protein
MKKTFGMLLIGATLTVLALPVFANSVRSSKGELQDPCSAEGKDALYAEFYKEYRGDQVKAYDAAKKYVACPAAAGDQTQEQKDAEAKRVAYLKDFMNKWEKAHHKDQLTEAIGKKDYATAFDVGKQVFADDPNYVKGYMDLANLGYAAQTVANNSSYNSDAINYAKKSLQMIDSGQAPSKWDPFQSKDDAQAWLNYIVAFMTTDKTPAEAIPYFIKAASYESLIKKLPSTYSLLAGAYESGPYAQQSADYKAKFEGKDESPESKLALENINQIVDRMIDAHARAVALAGSDAKYATIKTESMKAATDWYKFRHTTEAGLTDFIASVLSKPLPPVPQPITTLPTPSATPSATPAAGTGTSSPAGTTGGTAPKTTATPSPVKTPTSGGTTKAVVPGKPKMRKAHAGN